MHAQRSPRAVHGAHQGVQVSERSSGGPCPSCPATQTDTCRSQATEVQGSQAGVTPEPCGVGLSTTGRAGSAAREPSKPGGQDPQLPPPVFPAEGRY